MKLFECQSCGQVLYFENTQCERCDQPLGFLPAELDLCGLTVKGNAFSLLGQSGETYRFCENQQHHACNWLIPAPSEDQWCLACSLNGTIPNLSLAENKSRWEKLETAKHRLVYSLLRFGLPVISKTEDETRGLEFDFLAETADGERVLTGHDQGRITINIAEADPVHREKSRISMGERYRTLLGHFRHEVGHYYWDVLIQPDPALLAECRELFGDEQQDYGEALKTHYEQGPPEDWRDSFISRYATAHPWEDWAETWAHYLHLVDTLDTAFAFGLQLTPRVDSPDLNERSNFDPYNQTDFQPILDRFLPLSYALNSLNRSMGQLDAYPFVLSPPAMKKLEFVHEVLKGQGG